MVRADHIATACLPDQLTVIYPTISRLPGTEGFYTPLESCMSYVTQKYEDKEVCA